MNRSDPLRVLFVCMGNICRSPAGENIMKAMIDRRSLNGFVLCDSAGTIDYHCGKSPDIRMRQAAAEHGYTVRGAARQVALEDLRTHDLILAMDRENLAYLHALDLQGEYGDKIRLFSAYCRGDRFPEEVPDPYHGSEDGFHAVIEMMEDGCARLLEEIIGRKVPPSLTNPHDGRESC